MKFTSVSFLILLGLLSACSSGALPIQPGATPNPQASSGLSGSLLFTNATSKRSLSLGNLGSLTASNTTPAGSGSGSPAQPTVPGGQVDVGSPATSMPYPYYGGGEFNSYHPVMAEESVFGGNASGDLTTIYQQTILPLLQQWDPQARLLESRGNTQPDLKDPNRYEYFAIPGLTTDSSIQLLPDWIFRFASTPRKETLTVYVTAKESRVYRVVWSEPNLAIARVKVSVSEALTIARGALRNPTVQNAYPVYPTPSVDLGQNNTVVYELPAKLNWNVSLGQQGEQIIYYLSANYSEAYGQPGVIATPPLNPTTPGRGSTGTATGATTVSPAQPPASTSPDCQVYYQPYLYLSASVSLDAVTGKVLSVNRPVRYASSQSCKDFGIMPVPATSAAAPVNRP